MADAGIAWDLLPNLGDDPDEQTRNIRNIAEPTYDIGQPDDGIWGDALFDFDDAVPDDMVDMLLRHQFDRSPSPLQADPWQRRPPMGPHRDLPNAHDFIDLTANDGVPRHTPADLAPQNSHEKLSTMTTREPYTETQCLEQVLQVLPDISHDHVLRLFRKAPPSEADRDDWFQAFINNILEGGKYPTQRDYRRGSKRKLQAEDEDNFDEFEKAPPPAELKEAYKISGSRLLRDAFPDMRYVHIQGVFKKHKSVFKAYAELVNDAETGAGKLERPRKKRKGSDEPSFDEEEKVQVLSDLPTGIEQSEPFRRASKELQAARRKQVRDNERRRQAEADALAERQNEMLAHQQGSTHECGCCCSEYPLNRMVVCENPDSTASPHWLCWACVKMHVETEIGMGRHRIVCFHVDGCTHGFAQGQLLLAVPQQYIDKMAKMEQDDDIRRAELDGLTECPFCDFKAICPPAEVDREFRCENPECGIVSCRLCQLETHVPLSCAEMAKQKGVDARHTVEEAMTAALLRSCNKCKKTFIKDHGCNKMACTGCGNLQCYVCSKDIKDYRHFGNGNGKCPLHDNTDKRHREEVEKAEKAALEKLRIEHPELDEDDLKVKVSEAVQQAEQANIRNQDDIYGFPAEAAHLRRAGGMNRPFRIGYARLNAADVLMRDDYEMQLMLLEQQNRRRLLMARQQNGGPARVAPRDAVEAPPEGHPRPPHQPPPAPQQPPFQPPGPPFNPQPGLLQFGPPLQRVPAPNNDPTLPQMHQHMPQLPDQLVRQQVQLRLQQQQQLQMLQMARGPQLHQVPRDPQERLGGPAEEELARMNADLMAATAAMAGRAVAPPVYNPGYAPIPVQHHVHMFANGPPLVPLPLPPAMQGGLPEHVRQHMFQTRLHAQEAQQAGNARQIQERARHIYERQQQLHQEHLAHQARAAQHAQEVLQRHQEIQQGQRQQHDHLYPQGLPRRNTDPQ